MTLELTWAVTYPAGPLILPAIGFLSRLFGRGNQSDHEEAVDELLNESFDEVTFGGEEAAWQEGLGEEAMELQEFDQRLDEVEGELGQLSETVSMVRSENNQIRDIVSNVEADIRKLLEVYEVVTMGVNPFIDDDVGVRGGDESKDLGILSNASDRVEDTDLHEEVDTGGLETSTADSLDDFPTTEVDNASTSEAKSFEDLQGELELGEDVPNSGVDDLPETEEGRAPDDIAPVPDNEEESTDVSDRTEPYPHGWEMPEEDFEGLGEEATTLAESVSTELDERGWDMPEGDFDELDEVTSEPSTGLEDEGWEMPEEDLDGPDEETKPLSERELAESEEERWHMSEGDADGMDGATSKPSSSLVDDARDMSDEDLNGLDRATSEPSSGLDDEAWAMPEEDVDGVDGDASGPSSGLVDETEAHREHTDSPTSTDRMAANGYGSGRTSYLKTLPGHAIAEMAVLEWLEYLVEASDVDGARGAIQYYGKIGWIDPDLIPDLENYLSGFGEFDEQTVSTPPLGLTRVHHATSLRYLMSIESLTMESFLRERWNEVLANGIVDVHGSPTSNATQEPGSMRSEAEPDDDEPVGELSGEYSLPDGGLALPPKFEPSEEEGSGDGV